MIWESTYIEGLPFHFQIGSVKTNIPWWRLNHERILNFFRQEEIEEILKKYRVEIIGGSLWDFEKTWDLDLSIIPIDRSNNPINWESVEKDINKLNHIALNEWRILLDITIRPENIYLPQKNELIDYIQSINEKKFPISDQWIGKICYRKKVIGSEFETLDLRQIGVLYEPLNVNGFLIKTTPEWHSPKIIDSILNSNKDSLNHSISVEEFLSMSPEQFKNFQNY